jgi:hypothetical protein
MSCSYPMRWQDAKFQGLAKARNDRLCGPEKHVDKKSSDRITSDGPSPKRQTVRRTSLGAPKEPEKDIPRYSQENQHPLVPANMIDTLQPIPSQDVQ